MIQGNNSPLSLIENHSSQVKETQIEKGFKQIWNESSNLKKVGLVALFVILSIPISGFYLFRDGVLPAGKWTFKKILVAKEILFIVLKKKFIELARLFYTLFLEPLCTAFKNVSVWTYNNLLKPVCYKIKSLTLMIMSHFKYFCSKAFDAISFTGQKIKRITQWAYDNVIRTIGLAISRIAQKVYVKILQFAYHNLLVPLGSAIKNTITWTYENVVKPHRRKIQGLAFLIITHLRYLYTKTSVAFRFIGHTIQKITQWAYENVVRTIGRTINKIAQTFFVKIPQFIYNTLLVPIASSVKNIMTGTYDKVLKPLGRMIQSFVLSILTHFRYLCIKTFDAITFIGQKIKMITHWIYDNVIRTTGRAVSKIAQTIFIKIKQFIYNNLLVPIASAIKNTMTWTYSNFLKPIAINIKSFSHIIFIAIPTTIYQEVILPIKRSVQQIMRVSFQEIILPIFRSLGEFFRVVIPSILNEVRKKLRPA